MGPTLEVTLQQFFAPGEYADPLFNETALKDTSLWENDTTYADNNSYFHRSSSEESGRLTSPPSSAGSGAFEECRTKGPHLRPPPGLEGVALHMSDAASMAASAEDGESVLAADRAVAPESASKKALAARSVVAAGGGLGGLTTAMIRPVPGKLSQMRLAALLESTGFSNQFDFVYIPLNGRRKSNREVAFINFKLPEIADRFYYLFNGRHLPVQGGDEQPVGPVTIVPADVQGLEANITKHVASCDKRSGCPLFVPSRAVVEVKPHTPTTFSERKPAPLPRIARPQVARFCAYCGKHKVSLAHKFCPYCGSRCPVEK
jgi:hypothetical protein